MKAKPVDYGSGKEMEVACRSKHQIYPKAVNEPKMESLGSDPVCFFTNSFIIHSIQ